MKRALITGITGQDGSYLAEYLLSKGYEVHGIIRRASTFNTQRLEHIYVDAHDARAQLFLHYGDLSDASNVSSIINNVKPDELYHLAAQSHVKVSFQMPEYTGNITGLGTARILEALRKSDYPTKFYQASSSEMFGGTVAPQNEKTPFYPRSPYAVAKLYAYWLTINYREAYGLFACNGILFNHESPRRGETFITRKITRALAHMLTGKQNKLYVGNLEALRDWGFAPEYVEAMWLMLQQEKPDDFVIGTGECHSVREFIQKAFSYVGLELEWFGSNLGEKGIVVQVHDRWKHLFTPGQIVIEIDPRYFRPTEVNHLLADITKARTKLSWQPRVTFDDLIHIMIDYDLKSVCLEPIGKGLSVFAQKDFLYTSHTFSLHNLGQEVCL